VARFAIEVADMTMARSIQPFTDFRGSLSSATYSDARERLGVKSDNEGFDEIREFLLNRYDGVDVLHSFLERGGETVDCVPVEQQLSLRSGSDVPTPPSEPPPPADPGTDTGAPGRTRHLPPQLHPDFRDPLGNQMWCPPGTVPVLRHTLDGLTADHSTLDSVLRGPKAADNTRRHAVAKQDVDNLGGASNINTWGAQLIPPSLLSTASQQWYSNAGLPFVDFQSVECGWRNGVIDGAPADSVPRLFVFYTRKDYAAGQGCYNDYCPNGFAYAAGANHVLHAELSPVSQPNGVQMDLRMGFSLIEGSWWFHVGGTWIGSYPASLFAPGTLATGARQAAFGGETTTGFGVFPPMGSGRFPAEGFGKAAYQRLVGVNDMTGISRHAQLTAGQVSTACYDVAISNNTPSDWGTFFFYGGPGGMNCP
jgi:hypothetical protein